MIIRVYTKTMFATNLPAAGWCTNNKNQIGSTSE